MKHKHTRADIKDAFLAAVIFIPLAIENKKPIPKGMIPTIEEMARDLLNENISHKQKTKARGK